MSKPDSSRAKKSSRVPVIFGVLVVLVAVVGFAWTQNSGLKASNTSQPVFAVRRGPLTISVTESGTMKSLEQVSLKNEVEGQTTIIYLIPEGEAVKKGDLLVELDASGLEDDLIQQQISVDNAEASFIGARENLAVVKNQAQSDISKAELDYQFAQEDVKQYVEGLYPQEKKEAESNITLAREELERAAETLKWSEKLYAEKYISQTELEADRLTQNRAQLNYELAVSSLELLENYTSPRKLEELKSDVEQMKMALERVKLQANADIIQAEADLKAKKTELQQQQSKLAKTENQIAKTKILAPRDGLVVYATSVQGGRRHREEPLQEGQAVRERQELIYLPSAESMMAEVQVHESSLEKVQLGMFVQVTVDALPGQVFTGRVAKIAPLPDARSAWMNPDLKVYPTEIHLDGSLPELRTGMNCQAEIIVEQHEDATYVPVQAVVRVNGTPTVYVKEGHDFVKRSVEIGLDNNSMVHVTSGLEEGELVLLTPPLSSGTDSGERHEEKKVVVPARQRSGESGERTERSGPSDRKRGRGERGQRSGGEEKSREDKAGPDAERGPGEQQRGPFGNMTDEQREEMRRRFENMTPEQKEELRRRMKEGGRGGERGPRGDGE